MSKDFMEVYDKKVIERFIDKLEEGENGCINWTGALNADGYGQISVGSREEQSKIRAHRWALGFALGCIVLPTKVMACHHCDNPACVNPIHLFPGDNVSNMADMVAKGRSATNYGARKYTDEVILEIKYSTQSLSELCKQYNVSKATASNIRTNKTWKHLVRS